MISNMVKLIRQHDDPVLFKVCDIVLPGEPVDSFCKSLKTICRAANGYGLAAPQIGITKRIIYISKAPNNCFIMINPVIVSHGDRKEMHREGCLSYPGIEVEINRWTEITVKFENEMRMPQQLRLKNIVARIAQHEIDHLDGRCRVRDALEKRDRPKGYTKGSGALSLAAHHTLNNSGPSF